MRSLREIDDKIKLEMMNKDFKEKRSTMVVLDTRKEIVIRELELLTDHIVSAKKSRNTPKLDNGVLQEFVKRLQSLTESFQPQIEELINVKATFPRIL